MPGHHDDPSVDAPQQTDTKQTDTAEPAAAPGPTVVTVGRGVAVPPPAPPPEPVEASAASADEGSGADEDFAALFAASSAEPGQADDAFEPGTKVSGVVEVISLRGEEVFLDLGGKATGYVLKEELRDREGNLTVSQGDTIEGVVAGTDANGVRIRTSLSRVGGDRQALEDAHAAGIPVEGKITGVNKGGFEIEVAGARGFCPMSQIDLFRPPEPEELVGQVVNFLITELRAGGEPILSRAALLRAERESQAEAIRASIVPGARLEGRVRSIQAFGAFVDLGGVDGLVHVSELSWDRVKHPNEVVEMGQTVEVVVLEVDEKTDRIALSLRKAHGDPWDDLLGAIQVGEAVEGKVARLTAFGAFVTLAPGVDGLIHISDMAHFRVRHPREVLSVGDQVRVKVASIELERRRISLSLKALADDPWDAIASKYAVGSTLTGKVQGIADFGVFVDVEPGVVALLPASESGVPQGRPLGAAFRVGSDVELQVLRVDVDDKKMALSTRTADEIRERGERGGGGRDAGGRGRGPGGGGPRGDRGPRSDGPRGGGRGGTAVAWKDSDGGSESAFGAALLAALGKKTDD